MNPGDVLPDRPATILDVAREAHVSKATVSLVLNGRASPLRISDATRANVLAAAARLSYTPNHAARSLRQRRTGAIMLVVSRIANPKLPSRRSLMARQHTPRPSFVQRVGQGWQRFLSCLSRALAAPAV